MSKHSWNSLENEFLYYASLTNVKRKAMDAFNLVKTGKSALDCIKLLYEYAEDIKDKQKYGEFMRVIGLLQLDLAETNQKLAEKIQENTEIKQRIQELENEITTLKDPKEKLLFKDGLYERENKPTQKYCATCYESTGKRISVQYAPPAIRVGQKCKYFCHICKNTYA